MFEISTEIFEISTKKFEIFIPKLFRFRDQNVRDFGTKLSETSTYFGQIFRQKTQEIDPNPSAYTQVFISKLFCQILRENFL